MNRLDHKLSIRKLNKNEKVNSFDCGDADLNEFILNESVLYRKALLAVSYVVEDLTDRQVLAYFSLANDRVSLSDFGSKTEFNRFRKHRFVSYRLHQELFFGGQQDRLPFPDRRCIRRCHSFLLEERLRSLE